MSRLLEGTVFVPPPLYWFALTPRQPAASVALRSVTDAGARRLLDAVLRDLPDKGDVGDCAGGPDDGTGSDGTVAGIDRRATPGRRDRGGRARRLGRPGSFRGSRRPRRSPRRSPFRHMPRWRRPSRPQPRLGSSMMARSRPPWPGSCLVLGRGTAPGGDGNRPLEQLAVVASVMDPQPEGRGGIKGAIQVPHTVRAGRDSGRFLPLVPGAGEARGDRPSSGPGHDARG